MKAGGAFPASHYVCRRLPFDRMPRSWTARSELTGSMWDFAPKNRENVDRIPGWSHH